MEPTRFICMKHSVLAASLSCLQSVDSPVHSPSVFGHIFDVSLSGHSYTYTFSSSEVSLSISSPFPSSPLMSSCAALPTAALPSFFFKLFYFFNSVSHVSPPPSDTGRRPGGLQQQQHVAESAGCGVEQRAGVSVVNCHEHGRVHVRVHRQRCGRDRAAPLGW